MGLPKEAGQAVEQPREWSFTNDYHGNFSGDLRVDEDILGQLAGILKPRRSLRIISGTQGIERVGINVHSFWRGDTVKENKQLAMYGVDPENQDVFVVEIHSQVIDGRIRDPKIYEETTVYVHPFEYKQRFQESLTSIILGGIEAWMDEEKKTHLINMAPWRSLSLLQKVGNFWTDHKAKIVSFGSEAYQSPGEQ